MYAIVEVAGKQYKVEANRSLYVPRLNAEENEALTLENVLLVSDGETIHVGTPNVEGASVQATVLKHVKGDKVIVFKKKRRKGYRVKNGHRQQYTQLMVNSLSLNGDKPTETASDETPEAEA